MVFIANRRCLGFCSPVQKYVTTAVVLVFGRSIKKCTPWVLTDFTLEKHPVTHFSFLGVN